jgi:hypothetical protein
VAEFNDRRPGRTKSQVSADRKAIVDHLRRRAAGEDVGPVRARKSDFHHLMSTGRVARGDDGKMVVVDKPKRDIEGDRAKIVEHVKKQGGVKVRPPEGARPGDINHLVKQGHLERQVKEEWDKQKMLPGNNHFGGMGSVKRKRAYLSLPQPRERTDG